jgi:hypothetical protein
MSELLLHGADFGNFSGNTGNRVVEDYMVFLWNKLGRGIVLDEFAGTGSLSEASGTRRSEKDGGKAHGKDNDLHSVRCPSFCFLMIFEFACS